ncbi:hypothetical protein RCL1_001257 [Eukaryota sp. TZLM3-RCL]
MRLELIAGSGLHPFLLGMTFSEVMKQIQLFENEVPSVRFVYNERDTLSSPLKLHLEQNGLVFSFDAISQRLSLIEVVCPTDLCLFFRREGREIDFLAPSLPARLNALYDIFGATTPGSFDEETNIFALKYPCQEFHFHIASQYTKFFTNTSKQKCMNLRVDYPDGAAPLAMRMLFFYSVKVNEEPLFPPLPAPSPSLVNTSFLYFQEVSINVDEHVIYWGSETCPTRISIGDPLHQITSILGEPEATYPRQAVGGIRRKAKKKEGYALNYFSLGLDLLIDGDTHEVEKVRVYSNVPGHPMFNVYQRVNFKVYKDTSTKSAISVNSTFDDVVSVFGSSSEPLVHNPASASNPLGPCHFYSYPGVVFEVIRNGLVASVTLS